MPRIKHCFFKTCQNNTGLSAKKKFFTVPTDNKAQWCAAAGWDHVPTRALFICEDHLNLEEDMENYLYWKTMNVNARLKPRVPVFRSPMREVTNIVGPSTSTVGHCVETASTRSIGVTCHPEVANKMTQNKPRMADRTTNCFLKTARNKHIHGEAVEKDEASSVAGSTASTDFTEAGSSSETIISEQRHNVDGRKFMMSLIEKKPMSYIGVPKQCFWIVAYLARTTPVTVLGILVTLYKIRNNDTFLRIADLFQISVTTVYRNYYMTLSVLSKFLRQFIYWPSAYEIKSNLPDAFKVHKEYSRVQGIIDCFEVQIEKSSNPVDQSLSWS